MAICKIIVCYWVRERRNTRESGAATRLACVCLFRNLKLISYVVLIKSSHRPYYAPLQHISLFLFDSLKYLVYESLSTKFLILLHSLIKCRFVAFTSLSMSTQYSFCSFWTTSGCCQWTSFLRLKDTRTIRCICVCVCE